MSVTEDYTQTAYCDVSDVERYLNIETSFGSGTDPTKTEVSGMTVDWSDYIDRETGHAWRERQVTEEFHSIHETSYYFGAGTPIPLSHRQIFALDSAKGDKLEIYEGDSYNDWLTDSSKTEGRGNDYWVDSPSGILYIYRRWSFWDVPNIRLTYRYGSQSTPRDIEQACAKLTAADIVTNDWYSSNIPGTDGAMDSGNIVEKWEKDVERILENRQETRPVMTW